MRSHSAISPNLLTTRPDMEVLKEAPTADSVATRAWARLNRPVPFVRSAMTSVVNTPSVAPLRPSSVWIATHSVGSAVNAKSVERIGTTPSPRRRSGRRPPLSATRPTNGANAATTIWGTTINADTTSEDRCPSACASRSARSGRIDAFANWNRRTQVAKTSRRWSERRDVHRLQRRTL